MNNIAVIGAGIVGICSAYYLQKSGYKVTIFDHKEPGSMTSYGHACTFADYACIPVNSPSLFKKLPSKKLYSGFPNYTIANFIVCYGNWSGKYTMIFTQSIILNLKNLLQNVIKNG